MFHQQTRNLKDQCCQFNGFPARFCGALSGGDLVVLWDARFLAGLKSCYQHLSGGLNCSIGFIHNPKPSSFMVSLSLRSRLWSVSATGVSDKVFRDAIEMLRWATLKPALNSFQHKFVNAFLKSDRLNGPEYPRKILKKGGYIYNRKLK